MFKKFDLKFTDINPLDLMGKLTWDVGDLGILFEHEIYKEKVNVIFKDKIKFNLEPIYINLTKIMPPGPPPHTDGNLVTLNIYINANGKDVTRFWKKNENINEQGVTGSCYTASDAPAVFNGEMECIGSFTANAGDVYLLNTALIHSVDVEKGTDPRYLIRVAWQGKPFEEVEASIEFL